MDIKEHLARIKELAAKVSKSEALKIRVPAANLLLANTKNRIANEGRNSNVGKIGNYSTKPAYYSRKQFVKKGAFKGVGKNGGKPRKTMYIATGYKGLRAAQGLKTDTINAEYSGDLMLSYVSVPDGNANIKQGLNTELSARKRAGLEKRFGPLLKSTKEEIAEFNKECALGFAELTIKTLK
jgi:hypothetical protein